MERYRSPARTRTVRRVDAAVRRSSRNAQLTIGVPVGSGGGGDFTRNSYLSLFMCPSVAKGGRITTIVPVASHVDHNEHSVQVVVTDRGLADLRGLGPAERARRIIDNCAHPAYRPYLHRYLERTRVGHIRHDLATCFELHRNLLETGQMLPEIEIQTIE